jgi:anti-sigma B factor antagonist
MPDEHKPAVEMFCGVPVVTAPEEIDLTNTAGLRAALLDASARGRGTFVVDMSPTRFCDSAGIHALVGTHKRSRAEGGEMLVALSAIRVMRIFAITGVDRLIPSFSTLPEALAHASAAQPAAPSATPTDPLPNSPQPP